MELNIGKRVSWLFFLLGSLCNVRRLEIIRERTILAECPSGAMENVKMIARGNLYALLGALSTYSPNHLLETDTKPAPPNLDN